MQGKVQKTTNHTFLILVINLKNQFSISHKTFSEITRFQHGFHFYRKSSKNVPIYQTKHTLISLRKARREVAAVRFFMGLNKCILKRKEGKNVIPIYFT